MLLFIIGFAVGYGAAGRRQNRQAGEQSTAAQSRDHGEYQTAVSWLCGKQALKALLIL